jgi:hypothetical protein
MEMQAADAARSWPAGQWLSDGSLDVVADINAQCIDFLTAMAEAEVRHCPALFAGQSAFWRNLSARARQRLAAAPWLLVDGGFSDPSRWRHLDQRMVHDLPAQLADAVFTGVGAPNFIRRVLVLGWHLARAERQLARVVLGMTTACADQIARLRLQDLDWLALHRPGWVRPRWERQPQVWRHLLLAARDPADTPLTQVSLRGLQLMASGMLAAGGQGLPRSRRDWPRPAGRCFVLQ